MKAAVHSWYGPPGGLCLPGGQALQTADAHRHVETGQKIGNGVITVVPSRQNPSSATPRAPKW
ncbi:hypothetical protein SAMN04487981_12045 [Streptomyces sp. cf386]|uniref:hypothetical protein n=1 Tax=Streptomyces sp. cf386 TaxID=1761904 RepID=UPI0008910A94|nr:hypothetical protein [Streptomyces sp. cf386]SDP31916.1 hypothetical protein SAMN04487981_12045 [Streptomyces sp. cf386]